MSKFRVVVQEGAAEKPSVVRLEVADDALHMQFVSVLEPEAARRVGAGLIAAAESCVGRVQLATPGMIPSGGRAQ